jgi:hypothetical protein
MNSAKAKVDAAILEPVFSRIDDRQTAGDSELARLYGLADGLRQPAGGGRTGATFLTENVF